MNIFSNKLLPDEKYTTFKVRCEQFGRILLIDNVFFEKRKEKKVILKAFSLHLESKNKKLTFNLKNCNNIIIMSIEN